MPPFKSINYVFQPLILIGFLAASQVTAAEGVALSGTEIAEKLAGNTLVGETANNITFQTYYLKNGTKRGYVEKGNWSDTDKGIWELEEKSICFHWSNWRKGNRYCRRVISDGDSLMFYYIDGGYQTSVKIENGNSRDL